MLISWALPIMSVYRLPHGQYGYSGHILNLPQNVISFINNLPRCPATINVIIVRKEVTAPTHRDFRVCRLVVLRALHWLMEHNIYYSDVTIDHSIVSQLPNDSDVTDLFVQVPLNQEQSPVQLDGDAWTDNLRSTFVPMGTRDQTEQQTIHSVLHPLFSQSVNWPSASLCKLNVLLALHNPPADHMNPTLGTLTVRVHAVAWARPHDA